MKDRLIGLLCTLDEWIDWQGWVDGDGAMDKHSDEDRRIYRALSYALIVAVAFTWVMVCILVYGLGQHGVL